MKLNFIVEGNEKTIEVPDNEEFSLGPQLVLSNEETDITHKFDWYNEGFTVKKFLSDDEFKFVKYGIEDSIKKIVNNTLGVDISNFSLEKYHEFVKDDNDHFKIVSQTRDLFTKDFLFDIDYLIPKLENVLNIKITDYDEVNDYKAHIIVRINRPHSSDFNPPHKDMYEHYDGEKYIPKFVNFWIPVCGVSKDSVLPICPKSHLIPESEILRTTHGSNVNNNKYRVRLIKSWGGSNQLVKPTVNYSEVLIFSSHLVHGLSMNEQNDITRVALEFRLYEKLD